MGYDQLIRRMKRIYLNDKEGVLQLQSEIAKDCNRAGNAIRELLARAEKAEARARELETSFRTEKCENGPECVELGRARKKAEKAEERAEKVERERDAAVKELDGVSAAVDDLVEFIDEQIRPLVQYDMYTALRDNADAIAMWQYESEWRGQKEE